MAEQPWSYRVEPAHTEKVRGRPTTRRVVTKRVPQVIVFETGRGVFEARGLTDDLAALICAAVNEHSSKAAL